MSRTPWRFINIHPSIHPCLPFASQLPVEVNVLKRFGVIDGKYTEKALSCPHVLVPHGAVLLLTCSVQDIQQTGLSIDHHLFSVRILQQKRSIIMIMQVQQAQKAKGLHHTNSHNGWQLHHVATRLGWIICLCWTCRNLNVFSSISYKIIPFTDLTCWRQGFTTSS